MTLNEVNNLKSDILFGSSHCSCGSCDSVLCFTKRNIRPNECRCDVCNEPSSCMMFTRNNFNNSSIEKGPYYKIKYTTLENVNAKSSSYIDLTKASDNNNEDKLWQKSISVQIPSQQICHTTIEYKNENKQSLNSNKQISTQSPIGNIVNKMLTTYNEMSVNDIVDKIKGIYNSCSLKVCKCVITAENNNCQCKPCECVDCKSYLRQTDYPNGRQIYPLINKTKSYIEQTCTCKPCDCEKCTLYTFKIKDKKETIIVNKTIFNQPPVFKNRTSKNIDMGESQRCSCTPCQCSKCKSIFRVQNNVVVGSVEEYLQHDDCLCLPCNCNNCRQLSTPITNNLMREMSTDMVENTNCQCDECLNHSCRQTTATCRCENRNSVINKPFVNDNQNIDIHRAIVIKKSNYDKSNQTCNITGNIMQGKKSKDEVQKTTDCKNYKSSTSVCECKEKKSSCEIVSLCPKDSSISICRNDEKSVSCICNPCECKICDKYKTIEKGVLKSAKFRSKCNCDICHCLYCNALLQPEITEPENKTIQGPPNKSKLGYKFTLNINQSVLSPAIQKHKNVKTGQKKESAKVTKETCTYKKDETKGVRTHGTRNISVQIHAAPSSGTIGYKIHNYLMQLPKVYFRPSPAIYENISIHSKVDNALVKKFVNEIMQIDEFGNFNFISGSVSSQNMSVNDVSGNSLTSIWSFPEEMRTQTILSSSNIIDKKIEICDLKELSVKNNSKHSQKCRQNIFLNKRKGLNEPCIFCGMCTFYKKSSETKTDEGVQNIRQCFAKTNIALINQNNESKQIINESKKDNNQYRHKHSSFEQGTTDEKYEVDSRIPDNEENVDPDENITLTYCNDYFIQRNILFKAKLITSELLKMLYKYQKANNEFESITKKVKIVCDEDLKKQDTLLLSQQSHMTNLNFKYSWSKVACISKNQKSEHFQSHSKVISNINNENTIDLDREETITIRGMPKKLPLLKEYKKTGKDLNNGKNHNFEVPNVRSKCKEDCSKVFKELSLKSTLRNELSYGNINFIHSEKARKNSVNLNNISYKVSENIDKNYTDRKRYHMIESIIQNLDQDEKTCENKLEEKNDPIQSMNEVVVCPPRGETKRIIKSIYDTCSVVEPRELLITQRGQKCLKCGFGSFKVNSISLRKISDHTVFIKWDKPDNMTSVQGYELFVDGRMVKKIYNPALTMAVVTCLPRTDRILFTIQTLTEPPTGHDSKASMVYCQR